MAAANGMSGSAIVRVSTANPSQMPARAARIGVSAAGVPGAPSLRAVVELTNPAANAMSRVVISAASVGSGE
jgi:hypothetical protein